MGRKANFAEKVKKGPGKKTKKQKDPVFINKEFGKFTWLPTLRFLFNPKTHFFQHPFRRKLRNCPINRNRG